MHTLYYRAVNICEVCVGFTLCVRGRYVFACRPVTWRIMMSRCDVLLTKRSMRSCVIMCRALFSLLYVKCRVNNTTQEQVCTASRLAFADALQLPCVSETKWQNGR